MAERLRTKSELKRLFTNLRRKLITDNMMSILIDVLWRDRVQADWDQEDQYQPDFIKNKPPGIHDPVTIATGSADYLSIDANQVLAINTDGLGGGGGTTSPVTETPAGAVDGVIDEFGNITGNTEFTLSQTPVPGSVRVWLNPGRQAPGVNYTISGSTLTFFIAPLVDDIITTDYDIYLPGGRKVSNEIPTGLIDGENTDFVLLHAPLNAYPYLNQGRQLPGINFTLSGNTISFYTAPFENDTLIVDYDY